MGSPEPRSRLASENKVCTKLEPEPEISPGAVMSFWLWHTFRGATGKAWARRMRCKEL